MPAPIPPTDETDAPVTEDIAFEDVYERLKAMAHRQLAAGSRGTLDTTALVHELYLRMDGGRQLAFAQVGQFFSYAARAMRHLLLNRARDRMRQKAGGEWARVTLGAADDFPRALANAEEALAIEEALHRLEQADARAAGVFELRYFAGLAPEHIAQVLDVTRRTVDRDWRYARAFLMSALE